MHPEQAELFSAFDARLGRALRDEGLERAQTERRATLELGRIYVKRAALERPDRTATADDAARGFEAAGLPANSLGNAAGALFRGSEWVFTGRWEPSTRASNHAHQNRVWRLCLRSGDQRMNEQIGLLISEGSGHGM